MKLDVDRILWVAVFLGLAALIVYTLGWVLEFP